MSRAIDTFLGELGPERADHPTHQRRRGPANPMVRADLNHEVLSQMLEGAEALAPFLQLDKAVVFGLIRDLVFGEAERSGFGLVAREKGPPRHDLPPVNVPLPVLVLEQPPGGVGRS